MKVLFNVKINSFLEAEIARMTREFPHVAFLTGMPEPAELARVEVIFGSKIDAAILAQAASLQLVVVPIVGADHLPLDLLRQKGVRVANSHGNSAAVAERGLAMILAFFGRIVEFHNDLKEGRWHGFWVDKGLEDSWTSLEGKSVSILGAGAIGRYMAAYVQPFGCRVIGFKRTPAAALPPGYARITTSLPEALEEGDILINLLPLTTATRGLLSRDILKTLKGKLLVNLGRGEVIDELGLYEALQEGILLGAAIDTWYTYPPPGADSGPPSRYPIHTLNNIIVSPHMAGFTPQAVKLSLEQGLENLQRYLRTGELVYEVDLAAGY